MMPPPDQVSGAEPGTRWAGVQPRLAQIVHNPDRLNPPSASGTAAAGRRRDGLGLLGIQTQFDSPASPRLPHGSRWMGAKVCQRRRRPPRSGTIDVPPGQGPAQVNEAFDGRLVRRGTGEEHVEPAVGISTRPEFQIFHGEPEPSRGRAGI